MTGLYRLAGWNIEITSLYRTVQELCKDYRIDPEDCRPDILVRTGRSDIEYEREKSAKENIGAGDSDPGYSDQYLEKLAVYRKIAERLPAFDTFLFHGSAVAVNGECYLFTAKSGTGKSTHTRLWRELLGQAAVMVNDDKPLIRLTETGALACGTPWDGKHRLSSNIMVPLKAICILERGETNSICEMEKTDAFPTLLQQTYRPADPAGLKKTLELIHRLNVCFFHLRCNMDISAAELSYRAMSGAKESFCQAAQNGSGNIITNF
ncbi:MAG: hypothetical protein IJQ02_05225 [Oscillospiraceae bacterium]|nr:hypothetical protein [Oscillospiraceae bacterium]